MQTVMSGWRQTWHWRPFSLTFYYLQHYSKHIQCVIYLNKDFAYQPTVNNQTHTTCMWFDEDTLLLCEKLDVRCYMTANPIVLINSNRLIDPTSDGWIHSGSLEETEIIDPAFSYLEHLQCLCEGGEHRRVLYLYPWASSLTLNGIHAEQKVYFLLFLTINVCLLSPAPVCHLCCWNVRRLLQSRLHCTYGEIAGLFECANSSMTIKCQVIWMNPQAMTSAV